MHYSRNAAFALHIDMMTHCDQVIGLSLSERIGGINGYSLLTSIVKSSLPFSYVNGASGYAPFCTELLTAHYTASPYHQRLKESLYTTPIGNSDRNFACDTKREIHHRDVTKCFRSGTNVSAVRARMALIDLFNDVHKDYSVNTSADNLGWKITETDLKHKVPTAILIYKRGIVNLEECSVPFNMYESKSVALPTAILDCNSLQVGRFLLQKYVCVNKLFQYTSDDMPKLEDVCAPKPLIARLKTAKGVTMKRIANKPTVQIKTAFTEKEKERQKVVSGKQSRLTGFCHP